MHSSNKTKDKQDKQEQGQNKGQQQRGQQQQQDQAKQQQQKAQQQQQQDQAKQQQQRGQQQQAPNQQQLQARQQQPVWQERRATNWQSEHREWQQRGGYNGYRIPDDRFRRSFGQNDRFRLHSLPVVLTGGYPRFQYGGFWFSVVDPWSEYWSDNWYENDDVYIDYSGDGYYLYNRQHPRDRIAVNVYVN